ncbi:MAG: hypothetical protein LBP58_03135 [Azoarcus sp.]|nr:hypothetical protein [Azoarcus sp.]
MARAAFFAASEFAGDFFPGVIDRAEEARTGMAGVPWYALKVAQAAEAAWFDQNDLEEVE